MPSIEYVGVWGETGEWYQLLAENGTKPVMEVLVDVADGDRIFVAPVITVDHLGGTPPIVTNGTAHRHEAKTLEEDFEEGMLAAAVLSPTGLCLASLYNYVIPRVATLMGRCYVPAKESK